MGKRMLRAGMLGREVFERILEGALTATYCARSGSGVRDGNIYESTLVFGKETFGK